MVSRGILTQSLWSLLMLLIGDGWGSASQQIPPGYRQVALQHGVPAESLYSLALTESALQPAGIQALFGDSIGQPEVMQPWPWTINAAGKGYRYASRLEAWQALKIFLKKYSAKRIDVGVAQVNLGWNGHYFRSHWEAFDPYINLHVAAAILRRCYNRHPGSWLSAAGCYHHPAGGRAADRYQQRISIQLARLYQVEMRQSMTVTWIEPRSLQDE